MREESIIVWFRNDLRLHDHLPLLRAVERAKTVVPVYILPEQPEAKTAYGFSRTSGYRIRFLRESVANLRKNLRAAGGELLIRSGAPETVLPELAKQFGATRIHYHEEAAPEERETEKRLQLQLLRNGIAWDSWWTATLSPKEDLPFPILHLPQLFTRFRTQVEKQIVFPEPLPAPSAVKIPPVNDPGEWPEHLQHDPTWDERIALRFKGGEDEALIRLNNYFWEGDHLRRYEETRNGLIGADYSSKFSPWLTNGCLSPRLIHYEVKRYEVKRIRNKSTYWLIFELLWRDFFRFTTLKMGSKVFQLNGFGTKSVPDHFDPVLFNAWTAGATGIPFIDAAMRELKRTGYLSNRARQNTASFFVHDLRLDWRAGAAWFESQLIDYDPCSNWCNWAYIAGVGNDPRTDRYFNIPSQGDRYDHNGDFIRSWCPELEQVPVRYIHHLHEYSPEILSNFGVFIGKNYPAPVVTLAYLLRQNSSSITP